MNLVSDQISPYKSYSSICNSPDEVANETAHRLISEAMRGTVTSGAWIPVVKKEYDAWYWIDGTKYSKYCILLNYHFDLKKIKYYIVYSHFSYAFIFPLG